MNTVSLLLVQSYNREATFLQSSWGSGLITQKLNLIWGHILILWHKSAASQSDILSSPVYPSPQQPGRVERSLPPCGYTGAATGNCRLSPTGRLWRHQLSWHLYSTGDSELSANTAAGKVDDGCMVCSNDFVTHRWKSRCFWKKTSQCDEREERGAKFISKIEPILTLLWCFKYSKTLPTSSTYRKQTNKQTQPF